MRSYIVTHSPLGLLTITEKDGCLERLEFGEKKVEGARWEMTPLLKNTQRELNEYFEGQRSVFDLPLKPSGTPFQQAVWRALLKIPYGRTCTYGDIAEQVGHPGASRAVGMANHQNPIAIVIPCHRVVAATGRLTGYAGGLDKKEYLLSFEHVSAQFDK